MSFCSVSLSSFFFFLLPFFLSPLLSPVLRFAFILSFFLCILPLSSIYCCFVSFPPLSFISFLLFLSCFLLFHNNFIPYDFPYFILCSFPFFSLFFLSTIPPTTFLLSPICFCHYFFTIIFFLISSFFLSFFLLSPQPLVIPALYHFFPIYISIF